MAIFFEHRVFWLPKDVENEDGYQDSFEIDDDSGRAAIADGASSSLFSGSWAQILTQGVVKDRPQAGDSRQFSLWLEQCRAQWREPINVEELAWHQKAKFQEGAFATLLWVELAGAGLSGDFEEIPYSCFAVGDCTLFHVRENETISSFPLTESSQFDCDPQAVGSSRRQEQPPQCLQSFGTARRNDLLALCTDAVAAWVLTLQEQRKPIDWESYWQMDREVWRQQIQQLRQQNKMRFDDATIILLRVGGKQRLPQKSGASVMEKMRHGVGEWLKGGHS